MYLIIQCNATQVCICCWNADKTLGHLNPNRTVGLPAVRLYHQILAQINHVSLHDIMRESEP